MFMNYEILNHITIDGPGVGISIINKLVGVIFGYKRKLLLLPKTVKSLNLKFS